MQETFAMDDQLRDSRERRQPPAARPGSPNKQMSTYVIEDVGPKRTFKIIVIGDSNVGKTCLTYRFCDGKFLAKVEATIGVDFREKDVDVEGEKIKLQLWDTAGQERFRKSMVPHYYRNVHAVIFVYDVTRVSSFENMPGWIEECNQYNLTQEIPRILVGNKCDMSGKAAVTTNLAQKFADMHNMPLFETSAMDDNEADHVEAIFLTLAHKLKNSKPMMPINSQAFLGHHDKKISLNEHEVEEDSCPC